jgi:hypothetical protein
MPCGGSFVIFLKSRRRRCRALVDILRAAKARGCGTRRRAIYTLIDVKLYGPQYSGRGATGAEERDA